MGSYGKTLRTVTKIDFDSGHRISAQELSCSRCREVKPAQEFYKNKTAPTGFSCYCIPCSKAKKREYAYGLTTEALLALERSQCGLCAICGTRGSAKGLAIDHSHKSGVVRGLLCHPCNTGLGLFKEDLNLLDKAKDYLRKNG